VELYNRRLGGGYKPEKIKPPIGGFIIRGPLLIPFGIPTQIFFSDTRHQKRSSASLNEYFGNAVAGKKPKLGNKMELIEVPLSPYFVGILLSASINSSAEAVIISVFAPNP
jgi:hypothetical protein